MLTGKENLSLQECGNIAENVEVSAMINGTLLSVFVHNFCVTAAELALYVFHARKLIANKDAIFFLFWDKIFRRKDETKVHQPFFERR